MSERAMDHDSIKARIDKAHEMVSALCRPRGSEGSREWVMSIPVREDHDPDVVISDALRDAYWMLKRLRAPAGESVEGWVEELEANCSCAKARTWEFDADCGHKTTNRRAVLTFIDSP